MDVRLEDNRRRILEVCISSVDDAMAAQAGGADRLELNLALELGGLTPSMGLFTEIKQVVDLPTMVMIRPRSGGFCYSQRERQQVIRDADLFLAAGAEGIAAGVLRADRTVHAALWRELVRCADDRDVVFHRAFDLIVDQETAIEQLIDFGTTRVLTSGAQDNALAGAGQIARLNRQVGDLIQLLPGCGVSAENIPQLMAITGCDQVHGSFSSVQYDPADGVCVSDYPCTSEQRVAAARRALDAQDDE